MSFKGDLSTIGLAEVFQMISMSQKEGTLVVLDAESRKAIYFGKEGVQLHSAGKRKGFRIGDILVRAGKISVGQLREVLEQQAGTRRMLGQELVARGLVTEQEIEDVVRSQIEEEIYDLFLWRKANFEFIEGAPIDELQDPETRAIRLAFDVNSLLLEAVRRTDEWTLINQKIPSMDCIYTFVSSSAREEEDSSASDVNRTVFQYIDGLSSVSDVIEQSFVPRFEVCKIIVDLLDRGRIRLLTPAELMVVARRRLEEGARDKGLRLFGVAVQLAPEDPDLIGKYAHALETEGMIQDAARTYVRVGHLLKQQGQEKDALAYFQRAVSLNPDDVQSKVALFEINLATASVEEAMATAGELIQSCMRERDYETAREIAEQAVNAAPQSMEMRLALAKVYHALGLKKERDDVVSYLRKNLPVDQAAADRIVADLRDMADRTEEAFTRPPPVVVRRRRGGISVGRLAAVVLILALAGGLGYAGWFELRAREAFRRIQIDASSLESQKKYDEARAKLLEFERGPYALSFLTKSKMRDEVLQLDQRRATTERKPPVDPKKTTDPGEKEKREREEAIKRVRKMLDELMTLDQHGRYDEALALGPEVIRLANQLADLDTARKAEPIVNRLAQWDRDVRNMKGEADRLEAQGQYVQACVVIDTLHKRYPLWKTAQSALFPCGIVVRPAGVKIYKKDGIKPWSKEPLALSSDRAVMLHLVFGHGKFILRFEKDGFVTQERLCVDERVGLVDVWLNERVARDQWTIGAQLQADPVGGAGALLLLLELAGRQRVYAMDNRRVMWDEPADTAPRLGPGNLVYFGRGKSVVGVDGRRPAEERVAWEFVAESDVTAPPAFSAKGDVVYVVCGTKVHAVDHATRKGSWTRELPDRVGASPVEHEGQLLVPCVDGTLYAFGIGNGPGPAWKVGTGGVLRQPPVIADGTLYLVSADRRVYAADAKSGAVRWSSQAMPGDLETRPCVSGDRLVVSCSDGTVACLDVATGGAKWAQRPGDRQGEGVVATIRAGVVVAGGLALVGDMKGRFHALEMGSGTPQWWFQTRGPIRMASTVEGDRVYVLSEDRNVYVLPLE